MQRRTFLAALGAAPFATSLAAPLARAAAPGFTPGWPVVEVWKSSTCGCCNEWISHLRQNGFAVKAYDTGNTAMRRRLGIPEDFGSCHTALVEGYAVEGHVPAQDIRRLLKEKPVAVGLAVPGMPMGSPGMEQGGRVDPYTVLLVQKDGRTRPFANHGI